MLQLVTVDLENFAVKNNFGVETNYENLSHTHTHTQKSWSMNKRVLTENFPIYGISVKKVYKFYLK